jgi:hypothetical protein
MPVTCMGRMYGPGTRNTGHICNEGGLVAVEDMPSGIS